MGHETTPPQKSETELKYPFSVMHAMARRLEATAHVGIDAENRARDAEHEATHDELTGNLNRRGFMREARKILKNHPSPENLVLIVIDFDRFKVLNDTFGHTTGDHAIARTGKFLTKHLRESDIVLHNVTGRTGGDEFYVLADLTPRAESSEPEFMRENLTRKDRLLQLKGRLKESFHEEIIARDSRFRKAGLDISLGAVFYRPNHDYLEEFINEADQLMYQQKHSKKALVRSES